MKFKPGDRVIVPDGWAEGAKEYLGVGTVTWAGYGNTVDSSDGFAYVVWDNFKDEAFESAWDFYKLAPYTPSKLVERFKEILLL